jgi:hypothetical protein
VPVGATLQGKGKEMKILIALVVSSLFFFAGCGGSGTKVAQKPSVIPAAGES